MRSHEVDDEAILATVKEVAYAPASAMAKRRLPTNPFVVND